MPKMIYICVLQMMILISLMRTIRRKTFHIKFYDTLTAVFSTLTHTQTRGLLEKVWFEYESSGMECQCLNNDK